MSGQQDGICPICMEEMDFTDLELQPCICGYKVAHPLYDINSIVARLDIVAEIVDSMGSCRGSVRDLKLSFKEICVQDQPSPSKVNSPFSSSSKSSYKTGPGSEAFSYKDEGDSESEDDISQVIYKYGELLKAFKRTPTLKNGAVAKLQTQSAKTQKKSQSYSKPDLGVSDAIRSMFSAKKTAADGT
ncbi:hypothetical protein KSP39_PZI020149 [Platanthera zijinensis]|uniref:Uncharacterized protein n=1 Tax=Platanthera zijinensis TaxID=2320716 RepID=A0AAP0FX76_9ASPA